MAHIFAGLGAGAAGAGAGAAAAGATGLAAAKMALMGDIFKGITGAGGGGSAPVEGMTAPNLMGGQAMPTLSNSSTSTSAIQGASNQTPTFQQPVNPMGSPTQQQDFRPFTQLFTDEEKQKYGLVPDRRAGGSLW